MLSIWPYVEDEFRLVEILLEACADIDVQDKDGETPLHTAYRNNRHDIVESLVQNYANKDAKNNKGESPSQLAPPT